jgi:hypothetical protein
MSHLGYKASQRGVRAPDGMPPVHAAGNADVFRSDN